MNHPPKQREGEIFLGNMQLANVPRCHWATLRLGIKPYSSDGDTLSEDDAAQLRPAFVEADEMRKAIENCTSPRDRKLLRDLLAKAKE